MRGESERESVSGLKRERSKERDSNRKRERDAGRERGMKTLDCFHGRGFCRLPGGLSWAVCHPHAARREAEVLLDGAESRWQ